MTSTNMAHFASSMQHHRQQENGGGNGVGSDPFGSSHQPERFSFAGSNDGSSTMPNHNFNLEVDPFHQATFKDIHVGTNQSLFEDQLSYAMFCASDLALLDDIADTQDSTNGNIPAPPPSMPAETAPPPAANATSPWTNSGSMVSNIKQYVVSKVGLDSFRGNTTSKTNNGTLLRSSNTTFSFSRSIPPRVSPPANPLESTSSMGWFAQGTPVEGAIRPSEVFPEDFKCQGTQDEATRPFDPTSNKLLDHVVTNAEGEEGIEVMYNHSYIQQKDPNMPGLSPTFDDSLSSFDTNGTEPSLVQTPPRRSHIRFFYRNNPNHMGQQPRQEDIIYTPSPAAPSKVNVVTPPVTFHLPGPPEETASPGTSGRGHVIPLESRATTPMVVPPPRRSPRNHNIELNSHAHTNTRRSQLMKQDSSSSIGSQSSAGSVYSTASEFTFEDDNTVAKKKAAAKKKIVAKPAKKVGRVRQPKRVRKQEPLVKKYVQYKDTDVLSGRGGFTNNHSGNKAYRALLLKKQPLYQALPLHKKMAFSLEFLISIKKTGRFLQKDKKGWYIMSDNDARIKISQALREDHTPEGRAAKKAKSK